MIEGCPVGEGKVACPRCTGWKKALTSDVLTRIVESGQVDNVVLCDPLQARVDAVRPVTSDPPVFKKNQPSRFYRGRGDGKV